MLERFRRVPALALGAAALSGYEKRLGYTYLWLGQTEETQEPIIWRVLSTQGNGGAYRDDTGADYSGQPLFLLSDCLLGTRFLSGKIIRNGYVYFYGGTDRDYEKIVWNLDDPGSVWRDSDARRWCRHFAEVCLTPAERAAVLQTFKDDSEYRSKRAAHCVGLPTIPAAPGILDGDRVFFLSDEEAETNAYGFQDKRVYTAESEWWTRSYETYNEHRNYVQVGIVLTHCGGLLQSPATPNMKFFARPAMNFDAGRVLFASAEGTKTAAFPQKEAVLEPVARLSRRRVQGWELTLHDAGRDAFAVGKVSRKGNILTIPYQNAAVYDKSAAPDERISALLTDDCGVVRYYGNIALPESPSGEARLMLPAKCKKDWHLYVFSEQCRGPRQTDFAGCLNEVKIP